jgi:hypothetical protein
MQLLIQPCRRQQPAALDGCPEIGARLQRYREIEVLPRQIQYPGLRFRCFRRLQQLDQQTHLAGDAEGQRSSYLVPVALVEDVGQHSLQNQQRQDHDQQRAAEQAARHDPRRPHHVGQGFGTLSRQA